MRWMLRTATTEYCVEVLEGAGVPCGPVCDYAWMFADPQVRQRSLVQYASDLELGEVPHIRTPVRIVLGLHALVGRVLAMARALAGLLLTVGEPLCRGPRAEAD
jgi:crotonobetainyl-CoA:carnitine CoA-transferase CaiB-like acyl-CoA transferase